MCLKNLEEDTQQKMNILVDIGHPAHVHLYRNFITEIKARGWDVIITVRDIPAAKMLLDLYKLPYIELGSKSDSIFGKALNQVLYLIRILKIIRRNRIKLSIGSSIILPQISLISRTKSLVFDDDDDEVEPLFVYFAHPFASTLLSPDVLVGRRKRKDTIYYASLHELAYLHPNRFRPDPQILSEVGLKQGEVFFILRFNAFKAYHDTGIRGLSLDQKLQIINFLKTRGKIFITSESKIEPELKEYQLPLSADKIHSLMYFATMFIGDSQTMTSEAAVLGTPSVRMNSFAGRISYLEEEENKYGLTYAFKTNEFDEMFIKIKELLNTQNLKLEWRKRRDQLLADKIDLTAFMVWMVENWPSSLKVIRENPEYQYRFR